MKIIDAFSSTYSLKEHKHNHRKASWNSRGHCGKLEEMTEKFAFW